MLYNIYSFLNKKDELTPFCLTNTSSNFKITKTAHLETLSSKESSKTLSDKALLVCNDKGLYECRIKETGFKTLF